MEKKMFLQFEFQLKNGEVYWLPVFLKEQSTESITDIEMAITLFLSRHFDKVRRYDLVSGYQHFTGSGILNEYIKKEKNGEVRFLDPMNKDKIISCNPEVDSFNFNSDLSLYECNEYSISPALAQHFMTGNIIPVRTISDSSEIAEFGNHLIFKISKERAPAYLRPKNLSVFNRSTGFLTGLIIAMIAVLTAFSWTTVEVTEFDRSKWEIKDEIEDDWNPVNIRIEKPEPKKKVSEGPIKVVKVITEPQKPEEPNVPVDPNVDLGEDLDNLLTIEIPNGDLDKNLPFVIVEDMPLFKGCEDILSKDESMACTQQKIMENISRNFRYPQEASGVDGKIFVSFIIERDGSVNEVEVLKGIYGVKSLDKEAVRVVSELPYFIPGKQRGRAVRVKFIIPLSIESK